MYEENATHGQFCHSKFWDLQETWNTTDPDFSPCFQKTALLWAPCFVLALTTPVHLYIVKNSKLPSLPFSILNILKMVLAVSIAVLALADVCKALHDHISGVPVPLVDFISPCVLVLTMVLAVYIINFERKHGLQSTGYTFLFWLLMLIVGIIMLQSKIRGAIRESEIKDMFHFVTISMTFALVLTEFVLMMFVDKPEYTRVPNEDGEIPCPKNYVSFVSRLTFTWVTSLILLGYKRALVRSDLFALTEEETSSVVIPHFEKHWQKEVEKEERLKNHQSEVHSNGELPMKTKKQGGESYTEVKVKDGKKPYSASLLFALTRAYWRPMLMVGLLKLIKDTAMYGQPILLRLIIKFINDESEYLWRGFLYAFLMLATSLVRAMFEHQFGYFNEMLGMHVTTSTVSAIYSKMLKLTNAARKSSTVGEIVNLMSVDAGKLQHSIWCIHMLWAVPVKIAICMYMLYQILGWSILAGVVVIVAMIPLNTLIARVNKKLHRKRMKYNDERIKQMNEVLNGIKVLKMYVWEKSFEEEVQKVRKKELKVMKQRIVFSALGYFSWHLTPFIMTLSTFAVYVLSDENNVLDAEKAFVSLALFNILSCPLTSLPHVINFLVTVSVSMKRLQTFMENDEVDPKAINRNGNGKMAINVEKGTFTWEKDANVPTLRNLTMTVPKGSLVALVGNIGSGKSSMLSAVLGEMEKLGGDVSVIGSIAYVAQQAWIQNAKLKENILFGKKENAKRYQKLINACALRTDLDMLTNGDQTEIGEKGINLSGGQKQRVSLARAVYEDADLYLLDDPLSAVDAHVGKHIFDEVIGPNGMLKKKTRVLATHALHVLPKVDKIIVLVNGEISEMGTYTELLGHAGAFAEYLTNYIGEELETCADIDLEDMNDLKVADDAVSQLETVLHEQQKMSDLHRQVSQLRNILLSDSGIDSHSTLEVSSPGSRSRTPYISPPVSPPKSPLLESPLNGCPFKFSNPSLIPFAKQISIISNSTTSGKLDSPFSRQCSMVPTGSVISLKSEKSMHELEEIEAVKKQLTESQKEDKLIDDEEMETGKVKRTVFLEYLKAVGPFISVVIIASNSFVNLMDVGTKIWLGEWSKDSTVLNNHIVSNLTQYNDTTSNVTLYDRTLNNGTSNDANMPMAVGIRLAVYAVFGFGQGILNFFATYVLAIGCVRSAKVLHDRLLHNMMRYPMSFFDTTPVGRIVNRFSKDIEAVDESLPHRFKNFFVHIMNTIAAMTIVSIETPLILAILLPLIVIYLTIQTFYIGSSRQLKRMETVSNSPIYSHFNESIQGLSTIRAYGQQGRFTDDHHKRVDNRNTCRLPTMFCGRWLCLLLDMMGNFVVFFAAVFSVVGRDSLSAAGVGLSITYALTITGNLNGLIQNTVFLETDIVSVERVKEYSEKEQEAELIIEDNRPGENWPEKGRIEFNNYATRYREGLELVIKGITCTIEPGEKVGIVGRTGAGKSSLTLALFRIIEKASGNIKIDGIDISTIGLDDLRSKITIIPQDPVLFSGTLRINLDPFSKYSDDRLWLALEHSHLKNFVKSLPKGLEHECTEGGENLSVGQRQLICLARALLRKTKILVLDEATAAVDMETDDLIQKTIRKEFDECTIFTIAHRLNTIIDYSRIMVLDAGKIVEFDSPNNLLEGKDGIFYGLAKDAGLVS